MWSTAGRLCRGRTTRATRPRKRWTTTTTTKNENEEEEEKEKKEEGQSGPPRFSRYTVYSLALSCVHYPFPLFFRVCPPRSVCTDNANWKQKKTGSNETPGDSRAFLLTCFIPYVPSSSSSSSSSPFPSSPPPLLHHLAVVFSLRVHRLRTVFTNDRGKLRY